MSQGSAPRQADLFRDTRSFVEPLVRADSIHALLARECHALFPDDLFDDLFADVGRRSVPPLVVAVVMVLQRLEGLSDREAVERFTFDARWKYAGGGLPFDAPGFAHTVLVDMRARLARSERPNRIFERTLEVAKAAGLVGVRRVLDSTPLYDAVATMDTVTLVRSAIRGVLGVSGEREPALRAVLRRDDDYRTRRQARRRLGRRRGPRGPRRRPRPGRRGRARRARGRAAAAPARRGRHPARDGARPGPRGRARRPDPDRAASRARPRDQHGRSRHPPRPQDQPPQLRRVQGPRRARSRRIELVTATAVTPGNAGDASVALELLADELAGVDAASSAEPLTVYGDAAYGAGPVLAALDAAGAVSRLKVQPASRVPGHFTKDDFVIDLAARTVTCPAGRVAPFQGIRDVRAEFGRACSACPLVARCTTAPGRAASIADQPARGTPRRRSCCRPRSRLAGRLPGDPAEGRAQDRPPRPETPRRQASAGPGQAQGRRRLLAPRRRGQPRPARRPRAVPIRRDVGADPGGSVSKEPGLRGSDRPRGAARTSGNPPPAPWPPRPPVSRSERAFHTSHLALPRSTSDQESRRNPG